MKRKRGLGLVRIELGHVEVVDEVDQPEAPGRPVVAPRLCSVQGLGFGFWVWVLGLGIEGWGLGLVLSI